MANGIGEIARQAVSSAEILREPKAETPPAPVAPPDPPPPPPAPGIQAQPSVAEPQAVPSTLATAYKSAIDRILPKFEVAHQSALDVLAKQRDELAAYKTRALGAPGLPESPELPEAPAAPKITARPFLAGMPGEDPITSLNKAMAGFGLMAQMAVGIKGGFPAGALAAYQGALEGWKAGDQRRASNQWHTYLGELEKHKNDASAIRTKYEDAIRKWSGDQDRLKTELGILAAEHGLGREAIELSFKDPQRAFDMTNQITKQLSDMETSAATLGWKQTEFYSKKAQELRDFEQRERFHADKRADLIKDRGPKLSDENALRHEFITQSKDFVTVRDAYARIQAAAKAPSAAGDLALIFNYMKMLDPGSVVRETEFANAQNAASVPERIRAQYNRILSGERLSDETRKDFLTQSAGQFAAQRAGYEQLERSFRGIAERAGMDPNQIVVDFGGSVKNPGAPEILARDSAEYRAARQRGFTDDQITQRYGVEIR